MLREADIDEFEESYSYQEYGPKTQEWLNKTYPGYRLTIFSEDAVISNNYKPIFRGKCSSFIKAIPIFLHQGHVSGIKNINCLFPSGKKYCIYCEKPYNQKDDHTTKCEIKCFDCNQMGNGRCKNEGLLKECDDCLRIFTSETCFENHKGHTCQILKGCKLCGATYRPKDLAKKDQVHECVSAFCHTCHFYHQKGQDSCFITPIRLKKSQHYRIITFDFECTQKEDGKGSNGQPKYKHICNLIEAYATCTKCKEDGTDQDPNYTDCDICSIQGSKTRYKRWKILNENSSLLNSPDEVINSKDPIKDFIDWLSTLDNDYISVCISHNGGRYDNVLVLHEMLQKERLIPEVISNGVKIYKMITHKTKRTSKTIFLDSLNYMPMKLDAMPKAMGYEDKVQPKPFFPHKFNKPENWGTVQKGWPGIEYFYTSNMKKDELEKLKAFLEANKDTEFDYDKIELAYCQNDVDILRYGVMDFRDTFYELTKVKTKKGELIGDEIFLHCSTIASTCMRLYRIKYLKENSIAIIPENGYKSNDKQSKIAINHIKWYYENKGYDMKDVQFIHHPKGEHQLEVEYEDSSGKLHNKIKLDSYIPLEVRQTVEPKAKKPFALEVNGCHWHGCEKCHSNELEIVGKTAKKRRLDTRLRIQAIRDAGIEVREVWTHEIDEMLKKDPEMKENFDQTMDIGPIIPREAFYGGRTGPLKLKHKVSPGKKIFYYDFTSLYPWVNYTTLYPIGHPTREFYNQKVDWECSFDMKNDVIKDGKGWLKDDKGLFKVFVIPPTSTTIPVLPMKFDERLLFPLCKECAIHYDHEGEDVVRHNIKIDNYSCPHSDEERGWVGTYTHLELQKALDRGYRVTHISWAWHWEKWSDEHFKDYVRTFLKKKVECEWDPATASPDDIQELVEGYRMKFNINLDVEAMEKNPAMRTVAKLCLNSLWGRFSLRNNFATTAFINTPSSLNTILSDEQLEVLSIKHVPKRENSETEDEAVESNSNENSETDLSDIGEEDEDETIEDLLDSGGEIPEAALGFLDIEAAEEGHEHRKPRSTTILHNDDNLFMVTFQRKNFFIETHDTSKEVISLFTTASARIRLYEAMEKVVNTPGCTLLYTDTDSLIFEAPEDANPLTTGKFLGDFTDEYPNCEIVEFYSGGPKQYLLTLKKPDGELKYVMKIRGIALTHDNPLNADAFKAAVESIGSTNELVIPSKRNSIRPNKLGEIYSSEETRNYKAICHKGPINNEYYVLPFGYKVPLTT